MSSDFVIQLGLCQLQLLKGDITRIAVDAIVNAANSELAGGGGVDGAIHRAGGPEIMRELDEIRARIGRCETGSAVATARAGYRRSTCFMPLGRDTGMVSTRRRSLLKSCYSTCLKLAAEHDVESISFPSISTGIYGYPLEEAADIAVRTVAEWLHDHTGPVRVVKLVQFSEADHEVYRKHALRLRGGLAAGS